jgi:hypothetical protein
MRTWRLLYERFLHVYRSYLNNRQEVTHFLWMNCDAAIHPKKVCDASMNQEMAARALRHSRVARVNSVIVTTNKAPTISHSRVPLWLSGSMPKTISIQSLRTKVMTNKIAVTVAITVSSQKRHFNAFLIDSPFCSNDTHSP